MERRELCKCSLEEELVVSNQSTRVRISAFALGRADEAQVSSFEVTIQVCEWGMSNSPIYTLLILHIKRMWVLDELNVGVGVEAEP